MGKGKKKLLKEKRDRAKKKSRWLGVARSLLNSPGTYAIAAGLALGPVAAAVPYYYVGISVALSAASVALPLIGGIKVAKDLANPVLEEEIEKAETEQFDAEVLLLTDGKGYRIPDREAQAGERDSTGDEESPEDAAVTWTHHRGGSDGDGTY